MKNSILLCYANFLFWCGDMFSRLAYRFDNGPAYDLYQYFMHKSSEVQDKYDLSGPWQSIVNEDDI